MPENVLVSLHATSDVDLLVVGDSRHPGAKAVVVAHGDAPYAKRLAAGWPELVTVVRAEPIAVKGTSAVKGLVVKDGAAERTVACDVVAIDAPPSPAFELCVQAGAKVAHEPRGWVVETDGGRLRDGFFAAGEVTGVPPDEAALRADAERVARAVLG